MTKDTIMIPDATAAPVTLNEMVRLHVRENYNSSISPYEQDLNGK